MLPTRCATLTEEGPVGRDSSHPHFVWKWRDRHTRLHERRPPPPSPAHAALPGSRPAARAPGTSGVCAWGRRQERGQSPGLLSWEGRRGRCRRRGRTRGVRARGSRARVTGASRAPEPPPPAAPRPGARGRPGCCGEPSGLRTLRLPSSAEKGEDGQRPGMAGPAARTRAPCGDPLREVAAAPARRRGGRRGCRRLAGWGCGARRRRHPLSTAAEAAPATRARGGALPVCPAPRPLVADPRPAPSRRDPAPQRTASRAPGSARGPARRGAGLPPGSRAPPRPIGARLGVESSPAGCSGAVGLRES